MIMEAVRRGGNIILGLKFHDVTDATSTEITAYGTAAIARPSLGSDNPQASKNANSNPNNAGEGKKKGGQEK